jgi:hypothetical protein
MVKGQVKKIMKSALVRFAKENNVETEKVAIFIHTKTDDCEPLYFKTVSGITEKDSVTGATKSLDFNRDILNVKFDLMQRAYLTANFMKGYISSVAEVEDINAKEIYILIGSKNTDASELKFVLYHKSKALRGLTLEDIFGED